MSVRTRFWLLTGLRWLPTGFIIPVTALLPLHRGLTIAEMGAAFAMQGLVVLALELPTGGFADALGRKPVVIASGCFALLAYVVFVYRRVDCRVLRRGIAHRECSARSTAVRSTRGSSTAPTSGAARVSTSLAACRVRRRSSVRRSRLARSPQAH